MRRLAFLALVLALFACTSQTTPVMEFNDGWTFKSDDGRCAEVTLPHDAMIGAARSADAPGGGGEAYYQGGKYTYTKTFEAPSEWLESHAYLTFDGVYRNARVYVNDELAGECAYGYMPFYARLDGHLKVGKNEVRVEVDNASHPNSRWYPGGGIYRPVTLTVVPREHIKNVKVTTLSVNPAVIEVKVGLTENASEAGVEILDGGSVVAKGAPGRIEIPSAKLWSAETPHLYTARVSLKNGDVRETKFGIRTLEWNAAEGFKVNGESVLLKGGCVHHDNGIVGSADYKESEYRKVALLKSYGFNAIRCAHNPASTRLLEACDELGMYVMDELWDMWFHHKTAYDYASDFRDHYLSDIDMFVARDYNHPSVVMYSVGNEVTEPAMEGGMEVAQSIVDRLHELDPSRPATGGINLAMIVATSRGRDIMQESASGQSQSPLAQAMSGGVLSSTQYNELMAGMGDLMSGPMILTQQADASLNPILDALDIPGYNYGHGRYELEGTQHPDRIVVGSETMTYHISRNWKLVEKLPYLVGDFMWTAWDYLGEVGIGGWSETTDFSKPYPWKVADTGALDILGDPTGEAFRAQAVWEGGIFLAVRPVPGKEWFRAMWRGSNGIPCWSWEGLEGKNAVVEAFTDAERVYFLLDGESLGEVPVIEHSASITVPYKGGKLEAVALKGDKETGRAELISATGEVQLKVEQEKKYSPDDVRYVKIALVGDNGQVWGNKDVDVTVRADGCELLALGSACTATEASFQSGTYPTYYGKAQAIVRGTGRITVSAPGMKEVVLSIR